MDQIQEQLTTRSGLLKSFWRRGSLLVALATVFGIAHAQQSTADATTRLIILGTQGGPIPHKDRAQPANVLVVNGTPYLIDAGNGVVRQLTLAGVPFTKIGRIFITHNHDDHNADWGTLMGLAWSAGRTQPTIVYGPPGTESMLGGFLQYFAPNAAVRAAAVPGLPTPRSLFKAHDIRGDGLVYADENIRVTAAENCHYHFPKGEAVPAGQKSFAFRFESAHRVIVFSGDTGECGQPMVDLTRGADILVHEVVSLDAIERELRDSRDVVYPESRIAALMRHMREEHSTPEQVGRLAQSAGAKMLVLTHLVPGEAGESDDIYTEGVRKHYAGPVVVARDLMEF